MRAFLTGYNEEKSISTAEFAAIPVAAILAELEALVFLARHDLLSEELWSHAVLNARSRVKFWKARICDHSFSEGFASFRLF